MSRVVGLLVYVLLGKPYLAYASDHRILVAPFGDLDDFDCRAALDRVSREATDVVAKAPLPPTMHIIVQVEAMVIEVNARDDVKKYLSRRSDVAAVVHGELGPRHASARVLLARVAAQPNLNIPVEFEMTTQHWEQYRHWFRGPLQLAIAETAYLEQAEPYVVSMLMGRVGETLAKLREVDENCGQSMQRTLAARDPGTHVASTLCRELEQALLNLDVRVRNSF